MSAGDTDGAVCVYKDIFTVYKKTHILRSHQKHVLRCITTSYKYLRLSDGNHAPLQHSTFAKMMSVSYYLFALIIISIDRSHGYLKKNIRHMSHSLGRHLCAGEESGLSQNQVQISDDQVSRSLIPKRKDTCKMFISGIIGTEPKEAYLNNNHYVINFALAVTGHYDSIHDWEKAKV